MWLHWQLVDSAFPTGAFAHSSGLEAAVQGGAVSTASDVIAFTRASIDQLALGALPIIHAVCARAAGFDQADALWDSHLANHVANRASRELGRTLVTTTASAFGHGDLRALKQRLRHDECAGHQATCWAAVSLALGIDATAAIELFTFTATRDIVSAAVRLNVCGPTQAQTIHSDLHAVCARACAHAPQRDWRQPQQSAPLIDLHLGAHDHLYSRLFRS